MPLQIIHQDITKMACDAIVNPTDGFYSGGGGADAQIHEAAGPGLELACAELPFLEVGNAEVTQGFNLPAKYVIHTTGPVWEDGDFNEPVLLRSCYMNSLLKAKKLGCRSVAFPLISSGTFGFPRDKVLRIATEAISDYLLTADGDMDVYVCVINRDSYELSFGTELEEFLDFRCPPPAAFAAPSASSIRPESPLKNEFRGRRRRREELREELREERYGSFTGVEANEYTKPSVAEDFPVDECAGIVPDHYEKPAPKHAAPAASQVCWAREEAPKPKEKTLDEILRTHDDSFAALLIKLIALKGMSEVECYKKANVSRNIFYNIRNNSEYKPSKTTVLSFAIALKLTMEDTEKLLKSAGFALGSNTFDLIIRFYIEKGSYDVFEINEALYKYDQSLLGC